jgi:hypothetical protein
MFSFYYILFMGTKLSERRDEWCVKTAAVMWISIEYTVTSKYLTTIYYRLPILHHNRRGYQAPKESDPRKNFCPLSTFQMVDQGSSRQGPLSVQDKGPLPVKSMSLALVTVSSL